MRRDGIDLNEVVQYPGRKLTFEFTTELESEEDLDLLEPISCQLEAVSTGNLLLVRSDCTTRLVLECSRCAEPVEVDFAFQMSDEFPVEGVPSSYSHDSYAKVAAEEPYQLFERNSLLVDTYIRQGLIINLPIQTLCREDCKGIVDAYSAKPTGHPAMMELEKFRN